MLIYLSMIDSPEDKEKFIKIYNLYEGLLYYISSNILLKKEDVEDAVQQTFLRIITHLDNIVEVDCPQTRSYIVIICRYCSINILKKQKEAMEVSLDNADEMTLQELIDDDYQLDALKRLKYPYRDILLLRYRHGYSPKEIAKILNMNLETVKKYIQRGKAMLKRLLDQEAEGNA